ncbi:MAG: TetR/AcrR family transcriptional regulator [Kineosporiaceae bacterium]
MPTPPATLRERRRQETATAILDAARAQLVAEGVPGVTLREVARQLGMAVSALYRYVGSRDDLITELLVEAFTQHADAVDTAVDAALAPSGGQVRTASGLADALARAFAAYRAWALEHPAQFGLAYGAPLPGYRAPAERTIAVAARPGDRLASLVAHAQAEGLLDAQRARARAAELDPGTAADLAALVQRRGYGLDVGWMALLTDTFSRVHGLVAMEVFGHLRPFTADGEAYAAHAVRTCLAAFGLPVGEGDTPADD